MNNIIVVKTIPTDSSVKLGQIYQYGEDFYIVAIDDNDFTGCLINLCSGNLWSNEESATETIQNNTDFVLFKGTLQITAE